MKQSLAPVSHSPAIFNLHVPPYGTGLDLAPKVSDDLRVQTEVSGEPQLIPVGSTAVRDAISDNQPLLGLHGHIHESRGSSKLGSTRIVNPGSEYQEGILDGAIIEFDRQSAIRTIQLVSG